MKTHELITRLQAEDPTGELECVVGIDDIYFCSREPIYYDGTPMLLVRDERRRPFWDVIGLRVPATGAKVQIHTLSAADVFRDEPNASIEYETDDARRRHEGWLERLRIKESKP